MANLGESLVQAFHRIDEMLEDTANLPEVRRLKKDPRDKEGTDDTDVTDTTDSTAPEDVDAHGEDGQRKVSMSEAVDLFQKLVSMKRQQAGGGEGGEASGAAGSVAGSGMVPPRTSTAELKGGGSPGGAPPTDGRRVCTLPPSHIEAGATAVVAALRGSTLYVANAGDSRAVICRRGKAVPLSTDHKPALASEARRIDQAGGFVTPQGRINGNLNLSRALGDLKYKGDMAIGRHAQIITAQPDITIHNIDKGDEFLVLGCDGIWDCMTNQQVVDFVRERIRNTPLSEICEAVLDNCIADDPKTTGGIGGDNMTMVIVQLSKS
mmetsp:Transcript_61698/g.121968  ORF Transcript_61698/g.121968 Transcript_61698/m.121968 type:complete len:322 (-) Transcript_61698:540-1505(-)